MDNNDPAGEEQKMFELLTTVFNKLAEPLHERLAETDARLTMNRYLMEIIYANAFLAAPENFDPLMDELIQRGRAKPVLSGPMPADDVIEYQARVATHLERFRAAVNLRLKQDKERGAAR